jgi:hypothetical protein
VIQAQRRTCFGISPPEHICACNILFVHTPNCGVGEVAALTRRPIERRVSFHVVDRAQFSLECRHACSVILQWLSVCAHYFSRILHFVVKLCNYHFNQVFIKRIQGVSGGIANILGVCIIDYSELKSLYKHLSNCQWMRRYSCLKLELKNPL